MEEDVILTLKIKVKRSHSDEVKNELAMFVEDFLDEEIGKQEGDIEESEVE